MSKVLSNKNPVLYSIIDLLKKPVEGYFHKEQLIKTQKPKDDSFFFIDKILGHKVVKNKKYYLVKFLYYDNRFNEYVLESDITQNFQDLV